MLSDVHPGEETVGGYYGLHEDGAQLRAEVSEGYGCPSITSYQGLSAFPQNTTEAPKAQKSASVRALSRSTQTCMGMKLRVADTISAH